MLSLFTTQAIAEEQTHSFFYGLLAPVVLFILAGCEIIAWHSYCGRADGVSLLAAEAQEGPLECSLPPEIVESLGQGELPESEPYPYDD